MNISILEYKVLLPCALSGVPWLLTVLDCFLLPSVYLHSVMKAENIFCCLETRPE